MQGLEMVLVRLASTVASALAKSLLTPKRGAGLVSAPVRPLPKPASPDRLARVLSARISAAYTTLPEHERLAAVSAVQLTADPSFAARAAVEQTRRAGRTEELLGRLSGLARRPSRSTSWVTNRQSN